MKSRLHVYVLTYWSEGLAPGYSRIMGVFRASCHARRMAEQLVVHGYKASHFEVREFLVLGDYRPEPSPETLAERAPPPPADLVQATQDGPHPAVGAKRVKGMKAVKLKEGK